MIQIHPFWSEIAADYWIFQECEKNSIHNFNHILIKGGFFSESVFRFSNLQKTIPHYYPELEVWICCLLLWVGNLNFMFRIVIWNIYFWRFEDLKNTLHFLKKPPLPGWEGSKVGSNSLETTYILSKLPCCNSAAKLSKWKCPSTFGFILVLLTSFQQIS